MSRIGKLPVTIPSSVEVMIGADNTVTVTGPKGTLSQQLAPSMTLPSLWPRPASAVWRSWTPWGRGTRT